VGSVLSVPPTRYASSAALGCAPGAGPCGAGPRNVLLAVAKVLVRQGLLRILETASLGACTTVARDGAQVRAQLRERDFELVLIDPPLVRASGEAQLQARSRRILLVTDRDHPGQEPLPGADIACAMLSESLDEAATGGLLQTLLGCRRERFDAGTCGHCAARASWTLPGLPLSPRELEIFRAIGAGLGPQRIAGALGLSVKTVESHREKIKQKLGLEGADALVWAAIRWRQGYRIG